MTHTPGPYEIFHGEKRIEILGFSGLPVAHIYTRGKANGKAYDMPVESNAALIAAAPELLEACKAARDFFARNTKQGHTPGPVETVLIAAIAKAEQV